MNITFVDVEVSGRQALFTDPITKVGGEKSTYLVPTCEAIKGILKSIYSKPSIIWVVDLVRVMNKIGTAAEGRKLLKITSNIPDLAVYTYLSKVRYQIRAHMEPNRARPELKNDWNLFKHYEIMTRCLERGSRRDVFLGLRDYQASMVRPCVFGEGEGYYDNDPKKTFGIMFHGFDYPGETGNNKLEARFAGVVMNRGVIKFIRPEECTIRKFICAMFPKAFENKEQL